MSTDGIPHNPKPPTAIVMPLAIPLTASSALVTSLSIAGLDLGKPMFATRFHQGP
jgi:hypothetical protein